MPSHRVVFLHVWQDVQNWNEAWPVGSCCMGKQSYQYFTSVPLHTGGQASSLQQPECLCALRVAVFCCEDSLVSKNKLGFKHNSAKLCHLIRHRRNRHYFTTVNRRAWDSEQGRPLWAPSGLHSPPVLGPVISPCGTVPRTHPGVGTWVPSSWPWAEVSSTSPLMPFSGYPSVKWSRMRAGNGEGHYIGAEEDGRSRRPLPWALPDISTVLVLQFVNGSLHMNGLICLRTAGMNLPVGAGER